MSKNNMNTIKKELLSNADKLNLTILMLSDSETNEIIDSVYGKYIDISKGGSFIWENMYDSEQINDALGWSYTGDFVGNNPCIMLFFDLNKWFAVRLHSGEDLKELLGESFAFEFYVVDEALSYMLCFSHHDQLIGAGKAKDWIKEHYNGQTWQR